MSTELGIKIVTLITVLLALPTAFLTFRKARLEYRLLKSKQNMPDISRGSLDDSVPPEQNLLSRLKMEDFEVVIFGIGALLSTAIVAGIAIRNTPIDTLTVGTMLLGTANAITSLILMRTATIITILKGQSNDRRKGDAL